MRKKTFGKVLNVLSGTAMVIGGALLLLKKDTVQGITLITAGISKMAAHELQGKQITAVKKEVTDINNNLLKTEKSNDVK